MAFITFRFSKQCIKIYFPKLKGHLQQKCFSLLDRSNLLAGQPLSKHTEPVLNKCRKLRRGKKRLFTLGIFFSVFLIACLSYCPFTEKKLEHESELQNISPIFLLHSSSLLHDTNI